MFQFLFTRRHGLSFVRLFFPSPAGALFIATVALKNHVRRMVLSKLTAENRSLVLPETLNVCGANEFLQYRVIGGEPCK